jgi:putative membrane protein
MSTTKFLGRLTLSLAIASLCGIGAMAQTTPASTGQSSMGMKSDSMSSGMGSADDNFVRKAAQGGMAEVELGKLAEQRAVNPEVKKFAERMVTDHTKANDQLKEVASSKNITLPQSLGASDEATKNKLSSLSGDAFDKAYMSDMVKDHTKDVAEFRDESSSAIDPAVKNFAAETLPTLESHLKEAKSIEPQVMREK